MKVVAFLLSVLFVARLMQAAPQAVRSTSDDADRIRAVEEVLRAHKHPEAAFPGPGPNPILILTWFNHGDPRVAMWDTVDSEGYQVIHNRGSRGTGVKPTVGNVQELQMLLNRLPPAPRTRPPEPRWLIVTFRNGEESETRIYDRASLPPEFEKVFGLANAHVAVWLPMLQPVLSISLSNEVTALALSPNGRILASGDRDSMVRLWDTKTGAEVVQINPHFQAPVNAVSFLPNGNSLVAASFHQIAVIDVKMGNRIVAWRPINTYVLAAAVSPDGKVLATGGRPVVLWDTAAGTDLGRMGEQSNLVRSVAISPDSKLVGAGGEDKVVRLWTVEAREILANLEQKTSIAGLAFDPKGGRLAVAASDFSLHFTIWDFVRREDCGVLECRTDTYTEGASAIAWSPDGQMLAIGAANGPIQLWQLDPAKPLAVLVGQWSRITGLAFFSDSRTLASSSADGTIKLWELRHTSSAPRREAAEPK